MSQDSGSDGADEGAAPGPGAGNATSPATGAEGGRGLRTTDHTDPAANAEANAAALRSSRRSFLKAGGIAAAGLAVGGVRRSGGATREPRPVRSAGSSFRAGLRPHRGADVREPFVRQYARLALHT
ncbi:twin-arginine translocation signal domain-containing protein [Glaciibacter sp. 2TAF33]|uniref:twin-arginine translocation signal domain-containing protein n=1 Tax=Glaciibacter sp. 2TAF33 TaxID=3233015 RepID=UPI003F8E2712